MIDGNLNYYGEINEFARLLTYVSKQTGSINPALKSKLKECMKPDGKVSSFTVVETTSLLEKFKAGLESSNKHGEKYFSRTLLYFIKDFEFALKDNRGYKVQLNYPLPSEAERRNQNTNSDVLDLIEDHFGECIDATVIDGNVIEYVINDESQNEELVVVIIDAHLKEQQGPIQRMIIDHLYPAGFRTVFSESDIYTENRELQVRHAPRGVEIGLQNEDILRHWPTPRSAHALEFYYGNNIRTYGAEDGLLYRGFRKFASISASLEDYIPALHERSYAMVDNMDEQMKTDGVGKAILITGGAHLDSLMSRMNERGMNYIVVNPHDGLPLEVLEDHRRLYAL